jgi:tRNA-modifying protein YgfZ
MTTPSAPALASPPASAKVLALNWDLDQAQGLAEPFKLSVADSPYGPQAVPRKTASPGNFDSPFLAVLTDYAVLSISGPDSATFLQGQLTNDVHALAIGEAQLNSFCTPKGRMLASGWLYRSQEHVYLWAVCTTLVTALQKRLGMFVMRSKAKVALEPALVVLGASKVTLSSQFNVAALGSQVRMAIVPLEQAVAAWNASPELHGASERWRALEITQGVARITAHTSELFVPQMLNFELVGGVNFKKGCYPGQEIVARSQYLGKLKRRMYRVSGVGDKLPLPGSDVWAKADEPTGQVVACARTGPGHVECLIEVQTDAISQPLRAQTTQGVYLELTLLELPYAIVKIA